MYFTKTSTSELDYLDDWSCWLSCEEKLVSFSTAILGPDTSLTVGDDSMLDEEKKEVILWLSGGTPGGFYTVNLTVQTDSSPARTETKPIYFYIL